MDVSLQELQRRSDDFCGVPSSEKPEDGKIPTRWMNTEAAEKNFWFNCMFHACLTLEIMADYQDTEL